jgi:hypothetical protein
VGASKREHIGIGIATAGGGLRRFRCAAGFLNLESIVIDHGTVRPAPASVQERFPWARFERNDRSCRLIAQRNRLAGPHGGVLRRVSRPRVGVTLPLGRGNRPCVVRTETCAAAKMEKICGRQWEAVTLCDYTASRGFSDYGSSPLHS